MFYEYLSMNNFLKVVYISIRIMLIGQLCFFSMRYIFFLLHYFIFQNCWWLVKNATLECLAPRCSLLQCLDLSWCGPYGGVSTETFMEFIHTCGHQLTVLRLNNCHFIDNYCLYMISVVCPNLIGKEVLLQ